MITITGERERERPNMGRRKNTYENYNGWERENRYEWERER